MMSCPAILDSMENDPSYLWPGTPRSVDRRIVDRNRHVGEIGRQLGAHKTYRHRLRHKAFGAGTFVSVDCQIQAAPVEIDDPEIVAIRRVGTNPAGERGRHPVEMPSRAGPSSQRRHGEGPCGASGGA